MDGSVFRLMVSSELAGALQAGGACGVPPLPGGKGQETAVRTFESLLLMSSASGLGRVCSFFFFPLKNFSTLDFSPQMDTGGKILIPDWAPSPGLPQLDTISEGFWFSAQSEGHGYYTLKVG